MKITSGELLKNLRKKQGLNQEAFAEKIGISTRHLSRMETNKVDISVSEFLAIMNKFDVKIEDLGLLYMNSKDYKWFLHYEDARNHFANAQYAAFYEAANRLAESPFWEDPHLQQLIAFVKISEAVALKDVETNETYDKEDVETLHKMASMTIKDFREEKISDYLLTYYEFYILVRYSEALSNIGEYERAINVAKALLSSKTAKAASQRQKDFLHFAVAGILTDVYMNAKMYTEALDNAMELFRFCIRKNMLHNMDFLNGRIAWIYKERNEEKAMYLSYFYRAYYWAVLVRDDSAIAFYRRQAKEVFQATLD